ncbi:hypothetical protein CRYUN_Cryun30bG0065600 [Craigia yunnanensis]
MVFQEVGSLVCCVRSLAKLRALLLNLLLCLNEPHSFCHQLDCSESTIPRLEKRIEVPLPKLSVCILRPLTNSVWVVIFNLFEVQGSCLVKDFSPQLEPLVSDLSFLITLSHSLIKMALQNIGASNSDDAFYRYKMPKMITKIEGRGNGIKTNVVNMVEIAKSLARPASYTTKYFGCELGAQSKFDQKTGTSLVNGVQDTAKLAGLLENFIKKYVQCYGCGNPETEIVITKTQMITLKCAACGFVSDVDMRDKLTSFILKNPPEAKKSSKDKKAMRRAEKERLKEGEAADEELKKIKKEAKKKGSSTTSKVAASKGAVTKKKSKHSDEDHSPARSQADENEQLDSDDDDVQWQTDTSLEAAQQRIQEQLNAVTADMVMLSTNEEKKKASPEAAKEVSLVLKVLYDNDILEEEFIMDWYQKGVAGSNKSSQIWKNVKPFIEWLQNAESEEE